MRVITTLLLFLITSVAHAGTTNVTSTGISDGGFPAILDTVGETYQLTENISCGASCFSLKADSVILELNGKTATYDNGTYSTNVLNSDFEDWTESAPDNWTVTGTVSAQAAIYWGSYDLVSTGALTLESAAFDLVGGKQYVAFAFIKPASDNTFVLNVLDASDDSVLATVTRTAISSRGFASTGDQTSDLMYAPAENISVKLQIVCAAEVAWTVGEVNIKPAHSYGIVQGTSDSTTYYPDFSAGQIGSAGGYTIQNGTITQGSGGGVYSNGIQFVGESATTVTIKNVTINLNGPNTNGIFCNYCEEATITDNTINSTSPSVLNRMYPAAGIYFQRPGGQTGKTYTIDRNTIDGVPQMGIALYRQGTSAKDNTPQFSIRNNHIRQNETVTEGYGIVVENATNATIANNTINPYKGRGILIEPFSVNVSVYGNSVINLSEVRNHEFDANGLEVTGIRVRNWAELDGSGDGHQNLKIYNNNITGSTSSTGVHAVWGMAFTTRVNEDDIEVYDNTISVTQSDQDIAAGIAFEAVDYVTAATSGSLLIHHNTITSNDVAIRFGYNDGLTAHGIPIYLNDLTASNYVVDFGAVKYASTSSGIDLYCNKITNDGAGGYPFYLNGTLSDIYFSHNSITNSNSGGYEAWADADESSDVIFCENGTIDVTGGGSVGSANAPCQDGSANCYSTAGSRYSGPYGHLAGLTSVSIGAGPHSITIGAGSHTITIGQ